MKVFEPSIHYKTEIHWIAEIEFLLKSVSTMPYRKMLWIIDSNVYDIYKLALDQIVFQMEEKHCHLIVAAGEEHKSLDVATTIYAHLENVDWTRSDALVAFGGGMIGDLVGFVAGTYLRGLPLVFIPTTLLSQVDSSVGGKVAVNTPWAKNQLGLYYPAQHVWICAEFLRTLPKMELDSGLGEVLKVLFLSENQGEKSLCSKEKGLPYKSLSRWMKTALNYKINVCTLDFLDQNERLLLNFGHTLGHGIESVLGYGKVSHGAAVALGILLITAFFEQQGLSEKGMALRIGIIFEQLELVLPTLEKKHIQPICQAVGYDKKRAGNQLTLVGIETFGKPFRKTFPLSIIDDIQLFLEDRYE